MNKLPLSRPLPVGLALAALMILTRSHHFASAVHLPDASWAVFLLAGALLPGWRPLAASAGIAAVMWGLHGLPTAVTVPLAGIVYLAGLLLLGAFQDEDVRAIMAVVPLWRSHPRLPAAKQQ